jgi:hypothetical protein
MARFTNGGSASLRRWETSLLHFLVVNGRGEATSVEVRLTVGFEIYLEICLSTSYLTILYSDRGLESMLEVTQLWPHRNVSCVWPGPNATSVQFGHVVVLENYRLFDIFDFLVWAAYIWSVVPGRAKIRTFGHPRHPQFGVVWWLTVCLLRCFYNKDYFRLPDLSLEGTLHRRPIWALLRCGCRQLKLETTSQGAYWNLFRGSGRESRTVSLTMGT